MRRLVALAVLLPFLVACGGSSERRSGAALAGDSPSDCQTSDMALRSVGMGAGTFHYALIYGIVNTGTSTCRLDGSPRLTLEHYQFRIPLRIHEDTMWPWYRSPKWGHPVKAVVASQECCK
jgi:hypothetical protein